MSPKKCPNSAVVPEARYTCLAMQLQRSRLTAPRRAVTERTLRASEANHVGADDPMLIGVNCYLPDKQTPPPAIRPARDLRLSLHLLLIRFTLGPDYYDVYMTDGFRMTNGNR